MRNGLGRAVIVAGGLAALTARAEQVTVAVAANFAQPMAQLETLFEGGGGHEATIVAGSTGQLYAQIRNGAPYDVFLAADQERPTRLGEIGLGVGATQFTYALGRLVLFSREPSLATGLSLEILAGGGFRRLAIANPRLAPYGIAARETLEALGLWDVLQPKLVRGENVGQAFAMVETRNAELGLVALASAVAYEGTAAWVAVPEAYHAPIRQDAILLARGRANAAAVALVGFLQGAEARQIIAAAGYGLP